MVGPGIAAFAGDVPVATMSMSHAATVVQMRDLARRVPPKRAPLSPGRRDDLTLMTGSIGGHHEENLNRHEMLNDCFSQTEVDYWRLSAVHPIC
jgi:hypothetical protein